jgi:hypothetical protein
MGSELTRISNMKRQRESLEELCSNTPKLLKKKKNDWDTTIDEFVKGTRELQLTTRIMYELIMQEWFPPELAELMASYEDRDLDVFHDGYHAGVVPVDRVFQTVRFRNDMKRDRICKTISCPYCTYWANWLLDGDQPVKDALLLQEGIYESDFIPWANCREDDFRKVQTRCT